MLYIEYEQSKRKEHMGKIKDQVLQFLERHNLEELPEDVTMEQIVEENKND